MGTMLMLLGNQWKSSRSFIRSTETPQLYFLRSAVLILV